MRFTFGLLVAVLPALPAVAQDITSSTRDSVYAEAQAERGREIMVRVCAECHDDAEFTEGLLESWAGATVADLFDEIASTMPDDNPGSLEPREYADALAYIFKLNGLPAGRKELDSRMEVLVQILIEKDH